MLFNLLLITVRIKYNSKTSHEELIRAKNTYFDLNKLLQIITFWRAKTVSHWYFSPFSL